MTDNSQEYESWKDPDAPEEQAGGAMGLMDHLEELRSCLVRSAYAVILTFLGAFAFKEQIYEFLTTPLKQAAAQGVELVYLEPTEAFFTYIKVSLLTALIISTPVIFYQLWKFISPGLYEREKKLAIPFVGLSSALFIGGSIFCFTTVFPYALEFLRSFETVNQPPAIVAEETGERLTVADKVREEVAKALQAEGGADKVAALNAEEQQSLARRIENRVFDRLISVAAQLKETESEGLQIKAQWTMQKYLSFTSTLLLAFGAVFEMPLVLTFLGRIGVVSSRGLRKKRKFAILGMFVVGALFTPPDPVTQCLMAMPMIVLYEASIWMVALTEKKKAKRQAEEEAEFESDDEGEGEVSEQITESGEEKSKDE